MPKPRDVCELCGKRPASKKAKIEGAILSVCLQCFNGIIKEGTPAGVGEYGKTISKRNLSKPSRIKIEDVIEGYGNVLKEAREKMGLSIDEAAKKLGVKKNYLSNIEKERVKPSLTLAKKMEKLYGIKILEEVVIEEEEGISEEDEATFSLYDAEVERD